MADPVSIIRFGIRVPIYIYIYIYALIVQWLVAVAQWLGYCTANLQVRVIISVITCVCSMYPIGFNHKPCVSVNRTKVKSHKLIYI